MTEHTELLQEERTDTQAEQHNGSELYEATAVDQAWEEWQQRKLETRMALEAEHEALRDIARKAGNKTFRFRGKIYQIRERKSKVSGKLEPFICTLKKSPEEWIRDSRAKKFEESTEQSATPEEEAEVLELVTTEEDTSASEEESLVELDELTLLME